MKKCFLLLVATISTNLAYSWEYLGAKNKVIGTGKDLEIATNGDVYVADVDAGLTGSNILITVKKFNGITWEVLPNVAQGEFIGGGMDLELRGSDIYVAYYEIKNFVSSVVVKKYEADKWVQVSTSLKMPTGGSSNFDLILDSDGVCYVLGAAGSSSTVAKIHKLTNNEWSPITATNINLFLFDRSCYLDANNDIYIPSSKPKFANGGIAYDITVFKLSGTTITTVGNTVTTTNGGTYNRLRVLGDGTMKLITSDNFKNTFYTLVSGMWDMNTIETTIGVNVNADIDAGGKWYLANGNKLFEEGNATALYDAATNGNQILGDFKIYDGYIYALVSDGVIKQPVPNATGLENDYSEYDSQNIYPNPTSDKLYINNSSDSYSIYNSLGVKVEKGIISGKSINVSQLDNGVYHLELSNNGVNQRMKFIKQ